jgi:hypothetical protein
MKKNFYRLRILWYEYIMYFICPKKKFTKKKKIKFGIDKIMSRLDILFIIRKLTELDKLKMLLFSDE